MKIVDQAKEFKADLIEAIKKQWWVTPRASTHPGYYEAYHNPIAVQLNPERAGDSKVKKLEGLRHHVELECATSASFRLTLMQPQEEALRKFFEERKKVDDKLGRLYREMNFAQFISRTMLKRYRTIYIDGRWINARPEAPFTIPGTNSGDEYIRRKAGVQFLKSLGTDQDTNDHYREYLTIEEMTFSHLVLQQGVGVMIGTGCRDEESEWNVKKELEQSIDIALFSYPAAAEYRRQLTLHPDLLFTVRALDSDLAKGTKLAAGLLNGSVAESGFAKNTVMQANCHTLLAQDELFSKMKNSPILLELARNIYGNTLPWEEVQEPNADNTCNSFDPITYDPDKTKYFLLDPSYKEEKIGSQLSPYRYAYLPAYINRTKLMFKQLLIAGDRQMQEYGLGDTYVMKGLGLGAFGGGIAGAHFPDQSLFVYCLEETLKELEGKLHHIKKIHLVNLPKDYDAGTANPAAYPPNRVIETRSVGGIVMKRLFREPALKHEEDDIGAIPYCGDGGSVMGNEGRSGQVRSSSDDPAALYSMADPQIANPEKNPNLPSDRANQLMDCIYVYNENKAVGQEIVITNDGVYERSARPASKFAPFAASDQGAGTSKAPKLDKDSATYLRTASPLEDMKMQKRSKFLKNICFGGKKLRIFTIAFVNLASCTLTLPEMRSILSNSGFDIFKILKNERIISYVYYGVMVAKALEGVLISTQDDDVILNQDDLYIREAVIGVSLGLANGFALNYVLDSAMNYLAPAICNQARFPYLNSKTAITGVKATLAVAAVTISVGFIISAKSYIEAYIEGIV